MFFVKREWKAALLVMGTMVLTTVNIPGVPFHKANFLLPMAYLLSEVKYLPLHLKSQQRIAKLGPMLLMVSVSALVAGLTSPYVKLWEFFQSELLFKYFAIAYAFWAVKDEKSLKPILRMSWYCLIVLTAFGILNYITKSANFVNVMTEGMTSVVYGDADMGEIYTEKTRFRVQSMFVSPFDYGFICVAMLLLHWYGRLRGMEKKHMFIIALVCCLFGIITCECRVVWVCAILALSCFYLWCFPLNKAALTGILVLMTFIISYSTVEVVEEKVNQVTDILKEDDEVQGSSIEMRMFQFAAVLYQIEGEELFGLGQKYWAETFKNNPDDVAGLLGIESVILQYLLERGIFGFVIWIVFYTWLFRLFWKRRKSMPLQTGLGAAVWVNYLFFAIGTGELGSVYPTLLLLGMVLKINDTLPRTAAVRKSKGSHIKQQSYHSRPSNDSHLRTVSTAPIVTRPLKMDTQSQLPKGFEDKQLAIVIPAYKAAFLRATLDSIAAQTCKDFTLYVGDDCSPEPIGSIVEQYRDRIDIVYQRFDTNLGGTDLVAQWERCIAMSKDEPYIWLFSDDDVMQPNCVEMILLQTDFTHGLYDVYHFDIDRIDERGAFVSRNQDYPAVLSAYDFYRGKNSGRLSAFVVENVFSRKVYEECGGFPKYDLAWGSDVSAWITFAGPNGLYSIPDARIKWRHSSQNITPNMSRQMAERKLTAEVELLNWAYHYFEGKSDIYAANRAFFIYKIHIYRRFVSKECLKKAFASFFAAHGRRWDWPLISFFAFLIDGVYFRIRKRFAWLYGDKNYE
jgi:glycosyltransferase involved in cell wall biosynthesis